jgi:hypothetical protein
MSPRIDRPDPTPPFLSGDLIQGWITRAISEERDAAHDMEINRINQMHAMELKMQTLAGDGQTDIGSVGRLTKIVEDFIAEQRESNEKAHTQRTAQGKQLTEIKQIPKIVRDLWKTVAAIITGVLLIMSLWSRLHPSELKLTPQQVQEIKRIP